MLQSWLHHRVMWQETAGIFETGNKKLSCVIILRTFFAHWSTLISSVPFAFTFADVTCAAALIVAHTETSDFFILNE